MGLMCIGQQIDHSEAQKYENIELVRKKGIQQFARLYHTFKYRDNDTLKYGDEVEYSMVKFDHKHKRVYLLLKAEKLMQQLNDKNNNNDDVKFMSEFGSFMIEGIPGRPYECDLSKSLLQIEANMKLRRQRVQEFLEPSNEHVMTFSVFPLLGCKDFTWPRTYPTPGRGITRSLFFPDDVIYQSHPRYVTSYVNNRKRRRTETFANIPIYHDVNTPRPFMEDLSKYGNADHTHAHAKPDHVYLEGMGGLCACLQVTFQAKNLVEARHLYDQLTPITPLMLALTASSPIWRGFLADTDCRWRAISESLDDRTPEEKGECGVATDETTRTRCAILSKSRFDTVDCYLSESVPSEYNDIDVVKHEAYYEYLMQNGVDDLMAQHISHLFIREPLIIFEEDLDDNYGFSLNDKTTNDNDFRTNQFENIQSTNWQSMRFKPPPNSNPHAHTGWRVEFRTMELQATDFENAALVTFLVLLSRAILAFDLDMLVPISRVDENMKRAQMRGACLSQTFFFKSPTSAHHHHHRLIKEMTLNEIMNDAELGLIRIVKDYLDMYCGDMEAGVRARVDAYLKLIENKANGKCKTTAAWMRDFVVNHKLYACDSIVSEEIAYDLMWELWQISNGLFECPELNGI